jgi:hypothetical protein
MSHTNHRRRELEKLSTEKLQLRLEQIEAELSTTRDPEENSDLDYESTVLPGIEEESQLIRVILFTRLQERSDSYISS